MKSPFAVLVLRVLKFLLVLSWAAAANAAVSLSSYSFSASSLPAINADSSDISSALAAAGSGGYYKLRAKIIVGYSPGYYHASDTANNNGHALRGVPGTGTYSVELYWVAYNSAGVYQNQGITHNQTISISAPSAGSGGLLGEYFTGPAHFQTPAKTVQGDQPDYDWVNGGPSGMSAINDFSIRWTGWIEPLYSETYTFTTGSDDGMRVFITNMSAPLAGSWATQGYTEASGSISLVANQRYQIKVEFFEAGGQATTKLFWQSASEQRQIVPITRLFLTSSSSPTQPSVTTPPASQTVNVGATVVFQVGATGGSLSYQWRKGGVNIPNATGTSYTISSAQTTDAGSYDVVVSNSAGSATSSPATLVVNAAAAPGSGNGLRGDYYSGQNFSNLIATRTDATVNFDWSGSPIAGVGADDFSVRWSGEVEAPVSGYYTFSTNNDDGVKLRIAGNLVIDDWTPHGPLDRFSSQIYLVAGSRTTISLEFYEAGGGAVAKLYWLQPGQSTREIIPQSRLYSTSGTQGWQLLLSQFRTIYFYENTDEEGNHDGTYNHSNEQHPFTVPGNGTLRVYTTGNSDTYGELFTSTWGSMGTSANGGGDGSNFYFERSITAGSYLVDVGAHHIVTDFADYTIYVEFLPAAAVPSAPVAAAASSIGAHAFTANWSGVTGATGYKLDVATQNAAGVLSNFVSGYQDLDVGLQTSRLVQNLGPDTTYYYRVRAYNGAATSPNSGVITVATGLAAPVATSASNIAAQGFSANWQASAGATGYRLDVSTQSSFSTYVQQDLDVGNVTTRALTSLTTGTPYYYRVRAYKPGFVSESSNVVSATPTTSEPGPGGNAATGGTIVQNGSTYTHTFTSSGTFSVPTGGLSGVRVLIVGGGGGGGGGWGNNGGGGGGGGGVVQLTNQSVASGSYTITIGAGGSGATSGNGATGVSSSAFGQTALGGGGGGGYQTSGLTGASGGGGGRDGGSGGAPNGGGTGGASGGSFWGSAGGGGGAGGAGHAGGNDEGAHETSEGNGGPGLAVDITGASVYYAGGGGGAWETGGGSAPAGGVGGGGAGSNGQGAGSSGANGLGGGGGGGQSGPGGTGGSGGVIIQYDSAVVSTSLSTTMMAAASTGGADAGSNESSPQVLTVKVGQTFTITSTARSQMNNLVGQQFDLSLNGAAWSTGTTGNGRQWQGSSTRSNTLTKTFLASELGIGIHRFRGRAWNSTGGYSPYIYVNVLVTGGSAPPSGPTQSDTANQNQLNVHLPLAP